MINRNTRDKYNQEYDVKIRRFNDIFSATTPIKNNMNAALSIVEPGETIREHTHELEEFFLIIGGKARLELNGESHELGDGDVALAYYNQPHKITNIDSKTIRVFSFWWKKQ